MAMIAHQEEDLPNRQERDALTWKPLRLLTFYRLILSGLLLTLFVSIPDSSSLDIRYPGIYAFASIGYLGFALLAGFTARLRNPSYELQATFHILADIVALTACQTGLGRRISGEGTMGMGRAFQYAGARSVLMSLWSVAESSSVMLVEAFFRHVKEGKSKLEALDLARKEIREAGYDHPFFWAPFILVGEVR